ncbi:hypothetical protein QWY84_19625 [Aquisalimonas lutea]|uniref:hypothetical protein n=1 Tax=Aquisalimonas lutea TaxID=1327750 RepID=UPI0025B39511|nr:hypothetical protein [Aquisalimonas lutea]MDN3519819.1 hypothetical protein [Aquisalimonas lutea]
MTIETVSRTTTARRLAWVAGAACVGCCAIPVLALAFGFTAVAGLGVYFERAALGFFVASGGIFLYLALKKNRKACSVDCSCKGASAERAQQR